LGFGGLLSIFRNEAYAYTYESFWHLNGNESEITDVQWLSQGIGVVTFFIHFRAHNIDTG
jgi:hypothetical protein